MKSAAKPKSFPKTLELIPGELSVEVDAHETGNPLGPFWSFVTEGLKPHGQPEMVIVLLRRRGESSDAFPREVLDLFVKAHAAAKRAETVEPGDVIDFGWPIFPDSNLRGAAFVSGFKASFLRSPPDAVLCVLITALELPVAKKFGVYRVLTRIGHANHMAPFGFMSDRDRKDLIPAGADEASTLDVLRRFSLRGTRLLMGPGSVKMFVSHAAELQAAVGEVEGDTPFALLTQPTSEPAGWMVWLPWEKSGRVLGGARLTQFRLTGFFLIVAPSREPSQISVTEDGFAAMLELEEYRRFKQAILSESAYELRPDKGTGLELCWIEDDD